MARQVGPFRFRLILLLLAVGFASLGLGAFAASGDGVLGWTWLLAPALVVVAAAAWLYFDLAPLGRDLDRGREIEDLYNRAQCGYHSLDADGRVVRINDTALTWLGYRREEVIGLPLTDLLTPTGRETFAAHFSSFKERGEVRDLEIQFRRKDGSALDALLSGDVVRDAEGCFQQSRSTFIDITPRKRDQERLEELTRRLGQARDAAESANRAKTSFLANMSHEIRTPLASIVGLVEILQQGQLSDEQRDQLATMATAAETLLGLIDDVLDISRIEAGKLELEAIPFDVRDLVRGVIGVLSPAAARKGLTLSAELADGLPARVMGDPGRLRQVLTNLVCNAVKFTASGGAVVRVTPEAGRMRFAVSDSGVGIAKERRQAIFEPFIQADASTARTHGGSGLGLAISSRLVVRMGGELGVESEPGRGSTFWFRVVLPATEAAVVPSAGPAEAVPGLRVLLVEDNPVNQQVLSLMLERAGHRVAVAGLGREALLLLERERFDLVLMDLQMPEMDGLRCTKLIRQQEKARGGRVPIVAVTANAMRGEKQRCIQAGMDDYLAKPVRGHELAAVIAKLLGRKEAVAEASGAVEDAPAWLLSLREMGFDDEGVTSLTRTFLDTVPGRVEVLRQAVAARDCDEVQRTAHSLKGSLSVFSAQGAIDATAQLLVLSHQREPDGFAAALEELERELGPLFESMRRAVAEE